MQLSSRPAALVCEGLVTRVEVCRAAVGDIAITLREKRERWCVSEYGRWCTCLQQRLCWSAHYGGAHVLTDGESCEAVDDTDVFCAFTASALRCQRGTTELFRSAVNASAIAKEVA